MTQDDYSESQQLAYRLAAGRTDNVKSDVLAVTPGFVDGDPETMQRIEKGDLYALLSSCDNDDLRPLVEIILGVKNNELENSVNFKMHRPDHRKYAKEIGDEIRRFGGHSIRNMLRGEGPAYGEIVIDVCEKLGVPCEEGLTVLNEYKLFAKFMRQCEARISSLPADEREKILKEARSEAINVWTVKTFLTAGLAGASLPLGLIFAGWDAFGPAYRVTAPCVLHLAHLRTKYRRAAGAIFPFTLQLGDDETSGIFRRIIARKDGVIKDGSVVALIECIKADKDNSYREIKEVIFCSANRKYAKVLNILCKDGDSIDAEGGTLFEYREIEADEAALSADDVQRLKVEADKELTAALKELESGYPGIIEGVATSLGATTGAAGSLAALAGLGTPGLSAAGITSGLATAGSLVGGGMVAGIGVLAVPIVALAVGGYAYAKKQSDATLAAALGQAIGKLYEIQNRLMENAEYFKDEIAGIKAYVAILSQKFAA